MLGSENEFVFVKNLSVQQKAQLQAFYQGEWWTKDRTIDQVEEMLKQSLVFALVREPSNDLAAFARVLTDGVFKALIFDVIVAPAFRGRGLGDRLMQRIVNDPRLSKVRHLELYCLPDLVPFYERTNFSPKVAGVTLMRRTNW
jgi:ribosomal protein S18 acetylase RimI-like enzyme